MILVRDSNRVVATAAAKSPKLTESDVVKICQMKNVHDDVLRIIANNKEWIKSYQIRLALVNNPKTPLQASMRFLSLLRDHDLETLSKSKSIPAALALQAKRIVAQKKR